MGESITQDESVRKLAPGDPIYVVSAGLDTGWHLLAWFVDEDAAKGFHRAALAHHRAKPRQPLWLGTHPSMPSHKAWDAWIAKHPAGSAATRCTGFLMHKVPWFDVAAWGMPV